jgi:heme-degrading monooxygenase HmoA
MRTRIVLFGIVAALLLGAAARAEPPSASDGDAALTAQPDASASPNAAGKSKRLIARVWHGRTLTPKADDYEKYLEASSLKKILATDGNHGIEVLRRTNGGKTDFIVISYWESIEAVKRFAGVDYEKAVILPRDGEFLIDVEPEVVHYEVVRAGGR